MSRISRHGARLRLLRCTRGASAVTYLVVVALVGLACVPAIHALRGSVGHAVARSTSGASELVTGGGPQSSLASEIAQAVAEDAEVHAASGGLALSALELLAPGYKPTPGGGRRRQRRNDEGYEREGPVASRDRGESTRDRGEPTRDRGGQPDARNDRGRGAPCTGSHCPPGESTCFVAGTPVLTSRGLVPIESVVVGDWVLARNAERAEAAYRRRLLGELGCTPFTGALNQSVFAPPMRAATAGRGAGLVVMRASPAPLAWPFTTGLATPPSDWPVFGSRAEPLGAPRSESVDEPPLEWSRVAQTFERTSTALVHVAAADSALVTTPEHPFMVLARGWTEARDLAPGDLLVTHLGTALTRQIDIEQVEPTRVYNIEVDATHTYHVGHRAILVHNADYVKRAWDWWRGPNEQRDDDESSDSSSDDDRRTEEEQRQREQEERRQQQEERRREREERERREREEAEQKKQEKEKAKREERELKKRYRAVSDKVKAWKAWEANEADRKRRLKDPNFAPEPAVDIRTHRDREDYRNEQHYLDPSRSYTEYKHDGLHRTFQTKPPDGRIWYCYGCTHSDQVANVRWRYFDGTQWHGLTPGSRGTGALPQNAPLTLHTPADKPDPISPEDKKVLKEHRKRFGGEEVKVPSQWQ